MAPAKPRLTELQRDVLAIVTDDWRGQRSIVWAVNGPLETTISEAKIVHALADLASKKLIEGRGRKTRAGSCGNNPREYRRHESARSI